MKHQGIVFIGGRDRGYECLQTLIGNGEKIVYIFCLQEDVHEPIKWGDKIVTLGKKYKIPYVVSKKIDNRFAAILSSLRPILIIVMGWRTIIPSSIITTAQFGAIAAHESLLPRYRGFAPVNWAVINGEKKTGVTLFFLDEGMDTGNIIGQTTILIGKTDTAYDVYQQTKKASITLLMHHLPKLKIGKIKGIKQNELHASYSAARNPDDGHINWEWPTQKIYNLIRALSYPYPGAYVFYQDDKIVIQKATIIKNPRVYVGSVPGRIVAIEKSYVHVLTGDGILQIDRAQKEHNPEENASLILRSIKGTLR